MAQSIFISAGEASGEHYGALLADALQKQLAAFRPTAGFFGMGGERMAAAGVECVVRSEDMAVMGWPKWFATCPHLARVSALKQSIRDRAAQRGCAH